LNFSNELLDNNKEIIVKLLENTNEKLKMLFLEKKKLKLEKQKQKKQTEQFLNQIVLTNLENNNREKDVILFIKCIWEN
jgi:hypothetical protein